MMQLQLKKQKNSSGAEMHLSCFDVRHINVQRKSLFQTRSRIRRNVGAVLEEPHACTSEEKISHWSDALFVLVALVPVLFWREFVYFLNISIKARELEKPLSSEISGIEEVVVSRRWVAWSNRSEERQTLKLRPVFLQTFWKIGRIEAKMFGNTFQSNMFFIMCCQIFGKRNRIL